MKIDTQGENMIASALAFISPEIVINDISMKILARGIETKCHYIIA